MLSNTTFRSLQKRLLTKKSDGPLQMVPHTRSREHWKVLLSKLQKSQMESESSTVSYDAPKSSSSASSAGETGADSGNVLYFASLDCYGFGNSVRTTAVEEHSQKAFDLRNGVMSTLSSKGYIIQDMGNGTYPGKVLELSTNFQKSLKTKNGRENKSVLLAFHSDDIPFSDAAAMVANKYKGVYAASCYDAKCAVAGRALFQTNMLVIKVTGAVPYGDLASVIDCWNQQPFATAPRSAVGEPPEWWLDDEEIKAKIKESVREVEKIDTRRF